MQPKGDTIGREFDLYPARSVQRYLISATSGFRGEFRSDDLLLAHAWPGIGDQAANARLFEGSRTVFALVFRTQPEEPKEGVVVPNYDYVSETLCSYLSLLYGKCFENHGAFESNGLFHLPNFSVQERYRNRGLPQNSPKPRIEFEIPLTLSEVWRIAPLFTWNRDTPTPEAIEAFGGACKFYRQGLLAAEHDPDVAYLHLITSGEILSSAVNFDPNSLLDEEITNVLARMETEMCNGRSAAQVVRSRIRSVKRRFVATFSSLVDSKFFEKSEAEHPLGRLKQSTFNKTLGAAYDLRSQYVHTGREFGRWVTPNRLGNNEVQLGRPVVGANDYERILEAAPTYIGLERIVRYGLLRFAEKQLGIDLNGSSRTG